MGSRGPTADPNRGFRGWREKRRTTPVSSGRVTVSVELPPMPTEPPCSLSEPARTYWTWAIVALPAAGVRLAAMDASDLAMLCELRATCDELRREMDMPCDDARTAARLVRRWHQTIATVGLLSSRFGMTPGARRRMGIREPARCDGTND